ncbi:MAG: peptidylprolyl isomerase [Candidatus Eremiobacteraeota bacterium]|nr:peptidylprolyl isomerase [Candidatus Eremiobacteraeota bacterium]MBV8205045.1 peptidylprolyl isomerase [Candidatus Eremiobacteraeota bacterium]MBV8264480.1 peptidylprolyl isomerase [Candidatus Eremiobacteraeota bacterium]MBV8340335.1 peptidylprolyl isomerase [Candidatus Eremiobacteraeota bacterium]MBV8459414.1 peptidylprolyl isomerase [Candidatus Eremiobacteraeota bacterium]
MLRNRFAVFMFAVALAALPALAGCASEDKTVVSVNGEKITKGQLDNRLEGQAGKPTLQQMVDTSLVLQYGKANNITVTDAEIQDQLTQLEGRFPPGQFDTIIKNQGLTMDDVKNIERVQIIIKKAVDKQVNVTDAQVADFYNKNKSLYATPAQVRARHILVKTKAEADSIEGQLKSGADFATLAKKDSTDPGSKASGGELGWFGPTQMVKPFSDVAFSLPVGQISQPVQTPFGWHIIQVEGRRPAQTASLADSAPKVRQMLLQQAEAAQSGPFIQSLRSKANIQIYDDRFNPLFPTPPPMAPGAPPTR